jgi:hypothetical protein
MMKRLLDARIESSHTSTKVHGRYCSAKARYALIESKTISVDVVVVVVIVVRQPLKERQSLHAKPSRQAISQHTSNPTTLLPLLFGPI